MTTLLTDCLRLLQAKVVGGTVTAPCPLCQPLEESAADFKMAVSPGRRRLLVCYCFRCCEPGSPRNADWWGEVCQLRGLPPDLSRSLTADTISYLWKSVLTVTPAPATVANADLLHRVYSQLLAQLELTDAHRKWLSRRGCDPDWCYGVGYRSTPADGLGGSGATATTPTGFGVADLAAVPGFTVGRSGWRWHLRPQAVLLPCRDSRGRIVALKQRLLDGKKGRLRLLSSAPFGGPKAVNQCHCPLGVGGHRWPRVTVTEGERKADFYWHRTERPAVAVPGTGAWRLALPLVRELLQSQGTVVVAMDSDEAGQKAAAALASALAPLSVEIAEWTGAKGLDDAVIAGAEIKYRVPETVVPEQSLLKLLPQSPRKLQDDEIVPWVKQQGKVLRESVPAYPPTVTRLIRTGKLQVSYGPKGQLVEVAKSE